MILPVSHHCFAIISRPSHQIISPFQNFLTIIPPYLHYLSSICPLFRHHFPCFIIISPSSHHYLAIFHHYLTIISPVPCSLLAWRRARLRATGGSHSCASTGVTVQRAPWPCIWPWQARGCRLLHMLQSLPVACERPGAAELLTLAFVPAYHRPHQMQTRVALSSMARAGSCSVDQACDALEAIRPCIDLTENGGWSHFTGRWRRRDLMDRDPFLYVSFVP